MPTYITTADVDTLLGAGWDADPAPGMTAERAVLMANTWLTDQLGGRTWTVTPDAVKQAGAEVAREAIMGNLYAAQAREVTEMEASATTGTHIKRKYAEGSVALAPGLVFALALLGPWMAQSGVGRALLERI